MSGGRQLPPSDAREEREERPVPEYERDQYFPERLREAPAVRRRIRERYGRVRAFFRIRPERFRSLQRWLNQARMGQNYDVYLTAVTTYAAAAGVAGLLLGAALSVWLADLGAFARLRLPAGAGLPLTPETLRALSGHGHGHRTLLGSALLTGLSGLLFGGATLAGGYYYPRLVADRRRRNIDITLPYAIVYMYALSYGGMKPMGVFRELADAEDIYGDVAREFQMIVDDVELFGNDAVTAIRDARNLTPNESLEQFLDDLLSILDSGSDFTRFLEEESQTYRDRAEEEQENFLQTLSILSEIFIVAFVAAPLFLIVTLVLVSLMGGDSLSPPHALVYAIMPVGMVGFLLLVDYFSRPFAQIEAADLATERTAVSAEATARLRDSWRFRRFRRRRRWTTLRDLLSNPWATIRQRHPLWSLALTAPVAAGVVATLWFGGFSLSTTADDLVGRTIAFGVVPFLVLAVPLTAFYEIERVRTARISRRFPDTLNILASANQMGIELTEALGLVARWSEGALAREMRRVRNDIRWNHDVEQALLAMGNRLGVPQVMRTMKLLSKGSQSTSDLARILSIAAEETRTRHRLERRRRQEMNAYIAIVVIGFLVYLTVVGIVNANFLQPIARMSAEMGAESAGGAMGGLPIVSNVPVEAYREMFFHSALIQGLGSGLIAGKLAENELLAGLKYGVALVLVTTVLFVAL